MALFYGKLKIYHETSTKYLILNIMSLHMGMHLLKPKVLQSMLIFSHIC